MKSFQVILFFFLLSLCLIQCRKDEIIRLDNEAVIIDLENAQLLLSIVDKSRVGLEGAFVVVNNNTYTSDENGVVVTEHINIPAIGIVVDVSLDGYETIRKRITGTANSISKHEITLLKATTKLTSTGTTTEFVEGGSLALPSFLEYDNGAPYTGDVTIEYLYLDGDLLLKSNPGNALGLRPNENLMHLSSVGSYKIHLLDDQSNDLYIPENEHITLTYPASDNDVENNTSLWTYSSTENLWVEEGTLRQDGNIYIAEVSHLSWWNVAVFQEAAFSCLNFKDEDSEPLPFVEVIFSNTESSFYRQYTDQNGSICGFFPKGDFKASFYAPSGTIYDVQEIVLRDENSNLEINTSVAYNLIQGIAQDCNSNPLNPGYGLYKLDSSPENVIIPLRSNGAFLYIAPESDHTFIALDLNTNYTHVSEITAIQQTTNINLGILIVCDDPITTSISGFTLLDSNGDGIADGPAQNVTIRIENTSTQESISIVTDQDGMYSYNAISDQLYELSIVTEPSILGYLGAGDATPDGDHPIESFEFGRYLFYARATEAENDTENNFLFIPPGSGQVSGQFLGDTNNDGTGDLALEWVTISGFPFGSDLDAVITNTDGRFSFQTNTGFGNLTAIAPSFPYIKDWDDSPDPEGDDSSDGSNKVIPTIVQDMKIDEDNNFVITVAGSSILARVMEDTDNDGEGDQPVQGSLIEIFRRGDDSQIIATSSNSQGIVGFYFSASAPEYTLRFKDSDYEVIDLIDTSPDNNPLLLGVNKRLMEIDINGLEWDAGNTFIVRKQ